MAHLNGLTDDVLTIQFNPDKTVRAFTALRHAIDMHLLRGTIAALREPRTWSWRQVTGDPALRGDLTAQAAARSHRTTRRTWAIPTTLKASGVLALGIGSKAGVAEKVSDERS